MIYIILCLISAFLSQHSYFFIAYLNKLQGIKGIPRPNSEDFEIFPTLRGFPQFPPLIEETGQIFLANSAAYICIHIYVYVLIVL